jgi:hypothetical protein
MAVDLRPDTLQRLQTELMVVKAQGTDLKFKIRQRQLVETSKLKDATMRRALRVRDHLITAPARHAPLLAAEFGLTMEAVHAALSDYTDTTLRWIAAREFEAPELAPAAGPRQTAEPAEKAADDGAEQERDGVDHVASF